MNQFSQTLKNTTEKMFSNKGNDKFDITCNVDIKVIDKKEDAEDRHLIELKSSDDEAFKSNEDNDVAGKAINGKEIVVNSKYFFGMLDYADKPAKYSKTLAHELGHTAGLRHPNYKKTWDDFVGLGNPPSTNFMNQGQKSEPTGITIYQFNRIYRLYNSDFLNSSEGTHPVDR